MFYDPISPVSFSSSHPTGAAIAAVQSASPVAGLRRVGSADSDPPWCQSCGSALEHRDRFLCRWLRLVVVSHRRLGWVSTIGDRPSNNWRPTIQQLETCGPTIGALRSNNRQRALCVWTKVSGLAMPAELIRLRIRKALCRR